MRLFKALSHNRFIARLIAFYEALALVKPVRTHEIQRGALVFPVGIALDVRKALRYRRQRCKYLSCNRAARALPSLAKALFRAAMLMSARLYLIISRHARTYKNSASASMLSPSFSISVIFFASIKKPPHIRAAASRPDDKTIYPQA